MSVSQNAESPVHDHTAATAPNASAEEPVRLAATASPPARRLVDYFGWFRSGVGLVGSIVMLIMGSLTVIFLLIPALKPAAPANQFDATLSDARIETGVVLSNYYARLGQTPPASLPPTSLASAGAVVSFTVVLDGFQGRDCRVVWSLFDAKTNARVLFAWLADRPGWPSQIFTPAGARDQANGEIFAPYPPAPGSYFVRVELRAPDGTRLATIDSPPFDIAAISAPGPASLPTKTGQ